MWFERRARLADGGTTDVRTLSNEGDPAGAAREFRIEELRVGEVLARGGQLVSLDEFMTSARDAC